MQPMSAGGRGAGDAQHQQVSRVQPIEVVPIRGRVFQLRRVVQERAKRRAAHVGQERLAVSAVGATGGRVLQERHPPGDQPPDLVVTSAGQRGRDRRQGIHVRVGSLPAPLLEQAVHQLWTRGQRV